ncbi:unc-13-like protein [Drosera capensis]
MEKGDEGMKREGESDFALDDGLRSTTLGTAMDDSLLERYRCDRRKMLEFILSSPNLITEIRSTSESSIDLDSISVDYVLRCVNSGGVLDFGEAIREYYCESAYPPTISSQSGTSFFIASLPKENRSPPRHKPPSVDVQVENHSGELKQSLGNENSGSYDTKTKIESANAVARVLDPAEVGEVLLLGLPTLRTGLSDDDLRESAYEVLIASMVFSGIIGSADLGRKKGRTSKLISGLKNKDDKVPIRSPYQERDLKLSDTIRMQMQARKNFPSSFFPFSYQDSRPLP